ncbi:MAG: dephospho-CoA kinase [Myxococcales bacterium]|nr:dephospho-CoA kinase [Myxococcales bacterium]
MRVLGITGGIGSGKSTVSGFFLELGMKVIDADQLAREAVAPNSAGLNAVVQRFGELILTSEGTLNRQLLGDIVFGQPDARQDLEAIVHPTVAHLYHRAVQQAQKEGATWVAYDVPLLFENQLQDQVDVTAVVWASLPQRKQRLLQRQPPLSAEAIEARIRAQLPLKDKVREADYQIDNDGPVDATRRRVQTLYMMLNHPGQTGTP